MVRLMSSNENTMSFRISAGFETQIFKISMIIKCVDN